MSSDAIPEPTRRFLEENIRSVTQLEILLLLRRQTHSWSVEEVARELRNSTDIVRRHMQQLHSKDLLQTQDGHYRYGAANSARDSVIKNLADLYQTHRSRIIDLIYADKVPAMQAFADAFKIKKDK